MDRAKTQRSEFTANQLLAQYAREIRERAQPIRGNVTGLQAWLTRNAQRAGR